MFKLRSNCRRDREREHGQIIVLFALVLVVILAFTSLVIDIGLLRNDRQRLVNAMDSGALAGGTLMPVDGTVAGAAAATDALVRKTVDADYPGLAYTITYRCLIGADPGTGAPLITRDIPAVCNPSHALRHAPVAADFHGAGLTRSSACDPFLADICNTVVVEGAATTQFSFGRVVGVTQGSTGTVTSAACNGPCGQPPQVPVDVVLILDRTLSMVQSRNDSYLAPAARAVVNAYDPTIQRLALGFIGPSKSSDAGLCTGSPAVHGTDRDAAGRGDPAGPRSARTRPEPRLPDHQRDQQHGDIPDRESARQPECQRRLPARPGAGQQRFESSRSRPPAAGPWSSAWTSTRPRSLR